jgi:glucose-1-phosphate cytidylyltransferase
MKTVILCGGRGTRIREANESLPKPMLPIGGRPILWHIMHRYALYGFDEFVLCLGYKGWLIKEFFLNYLTMTRDVTVKLGEPGKARHHSVLTKGEDWTVTLAETGETANTGGRILAIRDYVQDDDLFLLTYGDGLGNVDLKALVAFHRQHGRIATLTTVHPPGRFGELVLDDGRVTEFNEKPQASAGFINGGYFVLDAKRIWKYLTPDSPNLVWEEGPLRALAADGELFAFEHVGFWQPMDTPREYELLNRMWESGKAPWDRV